MHLWNVTCVPKKIVQIKDNEIVLFKKEFLEEKISFLKHKTDQWPFIGLILAILAVV